MEKIKVVFLGTPEIAVSALISLLESKEIEVVAVVTGIDKPIGRNQSLLFETPVAKKANEYNLNLIKTSSINKDITLLNKLDFDYLLTCAFGQFLSPAVLALPSKKALNIHGSLLPEGRGGAPIHWAIIKGKEITGISFMEMVDEMDAGDYYLQVSIHIDEKETYDSLYLKMSIIIEKKAANWLKTVDEGKKAQKQNPEKVTKWLNIKKEDAKIDFTKSREEVYNQIRGLDSKPGGWASIGGLIIKINKAKLFPPVQAVPMIYAFPGIILEVTRRGLLVATGTMPILIEEITIPGKKRNHIKNLLQGNFIIERGTKFNE